MTDGAFLDKEMEKEVTRRQDWTLDWFGARCDDYDPDCPVCRQWWLQDEWEKSISRKGSPMECDGESQGGKLEAMPGTKGDGARGPFLFTGIGDVAMTRNEILDEVSAVLSILDRYRGYPHDLDTHDPVIQECRDRLRKLVQAVCDHRHSYVERRGMIGEVICPDCGYTRDWGAY